ncbi:hypothetical protein [Rhodococcus sp. BH5]|uniref:hypothetical protein n=1 Tax=Rhodococcus sp. BH5 TaxID=2871702 RepID=UPI0022CD420C|nr:hypothetical protein [Rhodococcus sp. BH5]MCZ9634942.1 hypothetical protein [Rhodococcus sp. BH5]
MSAQVREQFVGCGVGCEGCDGEAAGGVSVGGVCVDVWSVGGAEEVVCGVGGCFDACGEGRVGVVERRE